MLKMLLGPKRSFEYSGVLRFCVCNVISFVTKYMHIVFFSCALYLKPKKIALLMLLYSTVVLVVND